MRHQPTGAEQLTEPKSTKHKEYGSCMILTLGILFLLGGAVMPLSSDAIDQWRRTCHGWEKVEGWEHWARHFSPIPPLNLGNLPRRCWPASVALSEALFAAWILTDRKSKT